MGVTAAALEAGAAAAVNAASVPWMQFLRLMRAISVHLRHPWIFPRSHHPGQPPWMQFTISQARFTASEQSGRLPQPDTVGED
jgi:hypothetical protein